MLGPIVHEFGHHCIFDYVLIRNMPKKVIVYSFITPFLMINLGRDLIWRYLIKALPKYFGELCYSCGETESSEHIFFNCKLIQPICNKIYSRLTSITNNTNYGVWSESILERLYDKF
ncbi:hypothetical protein ACTFIR_010815 [Dictyostelium discoideum]